MESPFGFKIHLLSHKVIIPLCLVGNGYKQKQLLGNASKEKQSSTGLATCAKFSLESFASGEVKRKFKRYMR